MRIPGWKKIGKDMWEFGNELITASVRKVGRWWEVYIEDKFTGRFNTTERFRKWSRARDYVIDRMREISDELRSLMRVS